MMKLFAMVLVMFSMGCRHTSDQEARQSSIVDSSPGESNDLRKQWVVSKSNVNYWWADKINVYAVTCYPAGSQETRDGGSFSTVEDCRAKFGDTSRKMSIADFKAKSKQLVLLEKRFSNAFEWRGVLDRHKGQTVDEISDKKEAAAFGKALSESARGNVTSIADMDLFLNEMIDLLQRDPRTALDEARDPESSKGLDKFMRQILLTMTVGRLIPDAATAKGYPGACKTRKILATRDIPDWAKRGDFYREEHDYTFLLIRSDDECERYGFETAQYYDPINDPLASKFVFDHAENTEIPDEINPDKVFGGGKLLRVMYDDKQSIAAYRYTKTSSDGNDRRVNGKNYQTLPSRYKPTHRLCRREEIQMRDWNPCP